MKKTIALTMILILALGLFVACGEDTDDEGNKAINVKLSIELPEDMTHIESVEDADVKVYEGDTALDALLDYVGSLDPEDEDRIQIYLGPGGTYVMGMGGVMEDNDAGTGWMYEVNGETVMVGANEYEVKDGDSIVWKFGSFDGDSGDAATDGAVEDEE